MRCPAVGFFQDVTVRLIAGHILGPQQRSKKTYLQGEVSMGTPSVGAPHPSHDYHAYCSARNEGSSAFVQEVAATLAISVGTGQSFRHPFIKPSSAKIGGDVTGASPGC